MPYMQAYNYIVQSTCTTYPICDDRFHGVLKLLLESVALENVNDAHVDQHTVFFETTLNVPFTVSMRDGGVEKWLQWIY